MVSLAGRNSPLPCRLDDTSTRLLDWMLHPRQFSVTSVPSEMVCAVVITDSCMRRHYPHPTSLAAAAYLSSGGGLTLAFGRLRADVVSFFRIWADLCASRSFCPSAPYRHYNTQFLCAAPPSASWPPLYPLFFRLYLSNLPLPSLLLSPNLFHCGASCPS